MFITPKNGKRIFGLLMFLIGLAITVGWVVGAFRARNRTSITEAHILNAHETMMGIGPVRHEGISTRYEFLVNGERFENNQMVDSLPGRVVQVRFDPARPNNNRLDLEDSSAEFYGLLVGVLLVIGGGLVWDSWKPIALFRPGPQRLRK